MEWVYFRYYQQLDGRSYTNLPQYVKDFCGDFYNTYREFLDNYVSIFEKTHEYINELLDLKKELESSGKNSFELIVTQNDNQVAHFINTHFSDIGDEDFNYIEKDSYGNLLKIGPTYYIEQELEGKDCIIIPGVDEINHMILARDLVEKTGIGVAFNWINPVTNTNQFSNNDLYSIGTYDVRNANENLAIRNNFINEHANTKITVDTYLTNFKANYDGGTTLTTAEANSVATNIYSNVNNKRALIGVAYFDDNLLKVMTERGNIFDLIYSSSWNTVGNSTGIALSSIVVGAILEKEVEENEMTDLLASRLSSYMEYKLLTVLEGAVYNNHKNPSTGTYITENEQNSSGRILAERISYVGGQGSSGGDSLIEEIMNDNSSTDYTYRIGNVSYTISRVQVLAVRPWYRNFEAQIVTLTELDIEEKEVTYQVEHYKENLDGTYTKVTSDTQTIQATAGASVTPATKTYEGFTSPSKQTVQVNSNGTTGVKYYYTRNSYTVTAQKGTGIESISGGGSYKYEQEVTLQAKLKEGYNNITWSGDKTTNSFTMPAENITVKANASVITYTITYNLNGGSAQGNPSEYTVETEDISLNEPTRSGYTFIGWTGSNGQVAQKEVIIEKGATGNKTYTANWQSNSGEQEPDTTNTTYQVEHYKENLDGTYTKVTSDTQTIQATAGASVTPATKTYEGFTSPNTQTVQVNSNGTTVVKYYYTRNSYTVTAQKGTGIESISGGGSYKYEQEVTLQATLKEGYSNITWSGDKTTNSFTMPAENITVKANASVITYTIIYNLNGGSAQGNPSEYTVETEDISLNEPTRSGYTFIGWTGSNGEIVQKEVIIEKGTTGNKTYTANWQIIQTDNGDTEIGDTEIGDTGTGNTGTGDTGTGDTGTGDTGTGDTGTGNTETGNTGTGDTGTGDTGTGDTEIGDSETDNNEDETISDTKLPQTGKHNYLLGIGILLLLLALMISYRKYKKYKKLF